MEEASIDVVAGEWSKYEFDVPEGALRFAINSCATGAFMLMIDDVSYVPAGAEGDANLEGYFIYRDGVKINDTIVSENDFTDNNVEIGKTYNYVVVAVFDKGTSKPSNTATITVGTEGMNSIYADKAVYAGKGFIRVIGFDNQPVIITTADGKVIASGDGSELAEIMVPAGIYLVTAGKNTYKIVVR